MNLRNVIVVLAGAAACAVASAQAPVVNIDPNRHGNLASAQQSIVQAYSSISAAQQANEDHLGGHAQRAKELLSMANEELRLAADVANENGQLNGPPPASAPPPEAGAPAAPVAEASQQPASNLSGNWTIYANNVDQPGSSLKMIQITQNGNIISGTFHGPHQHGKLQGWVNGSHVEFSTDTRDVLTFRGEITASGMSGLYGVHGQHAPWNAERTN